MKKIVFQLLLIMPSLIFSITRGQIVGNGYPYFLGWSPLVDSCWILDSNGDTIPPLFHSEFKVGSWNIGEAYVWGGIDAPNRFLSRINDSVCAGGYNTSQYGYYTPGVPGSGTAAAHWLAGIDCAAFVNRCLELTAWQGIKKLEECCLKIDKKDAKKGDALTKAHHAQLIVENNYPMAYVFESISQEDIEPKVRGAPVSMAGYEAYSIFPQFANEKPANGSEVHESRPEISVEVTGSGVIDIPYLLLDHTVEIRATNNRVNLYEDEYTWSFAVHSECPVVIFTDPADGEEDVDIYKDIEIIFNKPMDTGQDISVSEYQVIRDNMQYHFIRRNHSIVSLAVSLRSLEC